MKLSDFVFKFLYQQGLRDIFIFSGGGNIHLIDSVGKSKLNYICNHHEQACAVAAEGYARYTNNFGACLVTTGPGGTNAITGVASSWLDSIPILVISGQVKTSLLGAGTKMGLRQYGPQELNIIDIVKPITKYAKTVKNPQNIRYHLEKALFLAKSGRPGPVWLDIPLDIQSAKIKLSKLKSFNKKTEKLEYSTDKKLLSQLVSQIITKISQSKRPVLYAGHGIRLAGAKKDFLTLLERLKIPILTSYVGYDLIPSSHKYFFGRAHSLGQRAANFIVQNSDLFLSVGARLDILTTGFNYRAFARQAYKIMVDIDEREIKKPNLSINLGINYDAKMFIQEMNRQLEKKSIKPEISDWLDYGRRLNKKYPVVLPKFWQQKKAVNPYCFIETISRFLKKNEIIVLSNGTGPLNCSYQTLDIKPQQRVILNLGCAQMGYGLPAAIGACFANNKKSVICFEGDGSIHLNIHELQVIKHHQLPIKIFIYDNDGYLSIRNTQNSLFNRRHVGSNHKSGISCPDYIKIGKAYGIKTVRIYNHQDMEKKIKKVLGFNGPVVCVINALKNMPLTPKLMTKKTPDGKFISPPLEEMSPLLPPDEFKKNMLIKS